MKSFFITGILLLLQFMITAQVTTATLSGVVNNKKGSSIDRATIIIEFQEAGIQQKLLSKSGGERFVKH